MHGYNVATYIHNCVKKVKTHEVRRDSIYTDTTTETANIEQIKNNLGTEKMFGSYYSLPGTIAEVARR